MRLFGSILLLVSLCSWPVFRYHLLGLLETELLEITEELMYDPQCSSLSRILVNLSHAVSWFWTDWQGVRDDKIIAVCAEDPEYRHYKDIKELPPHWVAEICWFFEDCILVPCLEPFIHGYWYRNINIRCLWIWCYSVHMMATMAIFPGDFEVALRLKWAFFLPPT
jgi:hypothetical protein